MSAALVSRKTTPLAAKTLLLLLSVSLAGCATSNIGSSLMDARAEVPTPPGKPAYLPVEDLPSNRKKPALTTDEQSKLKQDLTAARDRQAAVVKTRDGNK